MKKLFITGTKAIFFFVGWAVLAGLLPIPDSSNGAVWRFWAELIPFLCVVGLTLIFWLMEKRKIEMHIISKPFRSVCIGFGTGVLWLGAAIIILAGLGVMRITATDTFPMLWLWLLSALINTIMQELLVRGYLYQMIKRNYNVVAAMVVTTALFTFMHGGAFEAGIVSVLNVITMSILMTTVLEYIQSLIAPVVMHFVWNGVGGIIFGVVSLADDYPHLFTTVFTGNTLLSGGMPKMEGSIVVLTINIALTLLFLLFLKSNEKSRNVILQKMEYRK